MSGLDIDSESDEKNLEDVQSQDKILEIARQRLALAEEAESNIRRQAEDDLKFRAGDQWPQNIQQMRNKDGRPCLVINRLPQFIQQVTNDQRQNRPGIKVHAVSDGAQEETAKVIQGLIRHIEYNSNAEFAYDTAFESAVTNGFGYFRIITDFATPESFEQEIFIKRIRDPLTVYFDPYSQEPDGSDAKWAFIEEWISEEEYREQFPDSEIASSGMGFSVLGNTYPQWIRDKSVRIAEYFYVDKKKETLFLLKTGEVVRSEELVSRQMQASAAGIDASIVNQRTAHIPVVKWLKINGIEILEQTEWPGSYIPIIPVYGAEILVNGQRILESVIRNAKDAQRMYNYWKSAETETIALAPRAPFIAAEGQLEGYEQLWETANQRNHAFLYYKPTTVAGQLAPPPQRQAFEPATQAITQAAMLAADDLKATTGVYDAALGQQSPDVSGVAIQSRQNQTQVSNFHFVDNLHRSMKHAGRILLDLIPKIYDTARTARIVHEDGTQELVKLNEAYKDETGEDRLYSMDVGRYDVTIDTGPSYASKRQEAAEGMTEMVRANPQLMQVAGDLLVKNMDWPGADELAERLRLALPPQLQNDGKQPQVPPQAMALIQQQHAYVQQLQAKVNEYAKIIETKQLELTHKERIEIMNLELEREKLKVETEVALAKLGTQSSISLLEQEIGALKHESQLANERLKLLGINQPIEAPNDFNPQEADGGNYAGYGHVGGAPTGGESPGQSMEQETP